jgi:hypothetical protein
MEQNATCDPKKMFLRDINNRKDYMDFFGENIRAGFLHKQPGGYELEPCDYYKVSHTLLLDTIPNLDIALRNEVNTWRDVRNQPLQPGLVQNILNWRAGTAALPEFFENKLNKWLQDKVKEKFFAGKLQPDWTYQNRPAWIQSDPKFNATAFSLTRPQDAANWTEGILVLTGWMDDKKHEYVFVKSQDTEPITDPHITEIVQDLESDDQISDWQKAPLRMTSPGLTQGEKKAPSAMASRSSIS